MLNNSLINKSKPIYIILKSIYGINKKNAFKICSTLGINPLVKSSKLTNIEIQKINYNIEQNYITGTSLKYQIDTNIKNIILLKNYKGKRHSMSLPVRGQRTRDNARTAKKLNR